MTSIRNSLFWSLCERHLSQVITLISSMILARLLTPKEIGIFSLCAAFLAVAGIFRDFGVSEYIIQEKELTKEKLSGAYALTTFTAWTMAAVLFSGRHLIANFYQEPALVGILNILCINFIVLPLASPGFAILNREMAFRNIFIIQLSSTFIHACTAVSLAMFGFSYMSLAWASLISIIIQTVLIAFFRPSYSLIFPNIRHIQHVWKFGLMFSSSRTIEVLMNNVHEFIIGRQFGFEALGIFSRALGLINLFWNNVTSAITRVAAPAFASTYHQSQSAMIELYKRSVSIFTVVAWPFFGFVSLESEKIILILFGDQWVAAAPIASIIAISALISAIFALAPNALIATGQVKRRLQISLLIAPSHVIGIALASFYSIKFVAIIWIITWTLALILYNYHLSLTLKFSYIQLIKSTIASFKITLITLLAHLTITLLLDSITEQSIIILPTQVLVMAITWYISIRIYKHPIQKEIDGLFIYFKKNNE